jgi:hypothetical protein
VAKAVAKKSGTNDDEYDSEGDNEEERGRTGRLKREWRSLQTKAETVRTSARDPWSFVGAGSICD